MSDVILLAEVEALKRELAELARLVDAIDYRISAILRLPGMKVQLTSELIRREQ